MRPSLALDFGAESGRLIAGLWDGTRFQLEELHRFPTGGTPVGDSLRWDVARFWREIQTGLSIAGTRFGHEAVSIGADTWGLDYVLLDGHGQLLEQPWHYRDRRNRGVLESVTERVSREEIFAASGVQFMEINTLYQLLASEARQPGLLARADRLLMIPDYLHFLLSGSRDSEFTNATTTQFFHPTRKTWATGLLEKLGLPTTLLPPVIQPASPLGKLLPEVAAHSGLSSRLQVIAPATHDTGSAVAGLPQIDVPAGAHVAFLSSGTWSLLGVELPAPNLSEAALAGNFTNEGGLDGSYRFLKNVMGLWIVQECRRAFGLDSSAYADLVEAARLATPFRSLIDPDHPSFLNPENMPKAIAAFCSATAQPVPDSHAEFIRCALESLALKYARVLDSLRNITGLQIAAVNIVGGGSRNRLLNQFTADACQLPVVAGPAEATALGNLLCQARGRNEIRSVAEMKAIARASSSLETHLPGNAGAWQDAAARFARLCAHPRN
jgi:rhamnulokinase